MSKRRSNDEFIPIGQGIRDMLNRYNLDSRYDEARIVASWDKLVGTPIASRTEKIFIRNNVLYVTFKTSSMKHDFLLHKQKVLELFQREFGTHVIRDIAIL